MFGKNPKRAPEKGDGSKLFIQEIFATIQGEGPRAGESAIFVRLGGCNLACKFCDTEFEDFEEKSLDDVLNEIDGLKTSEKLIVITGGEPLRQPIEKLCDTLISKGFIIQIETNGTLYRELHTEVEIVCSPKIKGQRLREDLLQRLTALKFVVSKENPKYFEVFDVGQSDYDIPIYVQPIDEFDKEKNQTNVELATQIVKENNYILSIQQHKILGLP